ncbi:DUF2169 family type VI secretion system accessory protein [Acanthopleuribacter pedis]|uniref:DUF2169 domain-containing protein n=1 Tax=Acanthopleuribacter pedis TaxID=442870 RepID=A0A8J7QPK8_9BACT|nr:DUF2169 domain-containing protein [Acanthopleuribacter pedis]MBO1322313.1 DUF2169 domain-containing protein [Acanthopleuribacter pedis]
MSELVNYTPYACDYTFARDTKGTEHFVVAVKGTFDFDGNPAGEQEPVLDGQRWFGEPAVSSLRYDSDLVLHKPYTDLILNASAYAPPGRPASRVDVGVRIGRWEKRLTVVGERVYQRSPVGYATGPIEPFASMPIRYEVAYGGRAGEGSAAGYREQHDENPVGLGWGTRDTVWAGRVLPSVFPYGKSLLNAGGKAKTAGFGAVPVSWAPRARFGGTYDAAWARKRQPLPPKDFDPRYHQAAPEDQQFKKGLRGGEVVELHHLTPDGQASFTLPTVAIGLETYFGRPSERYRPELKTLIVEPTERRFMMVWQAYLPCQNRDHLISRTLIYQKEHRLRREANR